MKLVFLRRAFTHQIVRKDKKTFFYFSLARRRAIELCGYFDPLYHSAREISNKIDELLQENPTKAAAYALFCRQKWRAIQVIFS